MRRVIFAILMLFLFAPPAKAANRDFRILSRRTEKFENKDCVKTFICGLISVNYIVEEYEVGVGDIYHYGTQFFAEYETESVAALEDYVFIQFIKGSYYASSLDKGELKTDYERNVMHYGRIESFHFPDWVVDTDNCDPVYTSDGETSRYHYLRWRQASDLFEDGTHYIDKKPAAPKAYVIDSPTSAFCLRGRAHNLALQFKICIYPAKDVPSEIATDKVAQLALPPPINCFEWESYFVYNHAKGVFENQSGNPYPPPK